MSSRTPILAVFVAICFLGATPVALALHYGFHVGWVKTLIFFLFGTIFAFIPLLGVYLHGPGPRRRSQLQKAVFILAPVGVGISYVIGSLLGYPRLGGAIGFAGVLGAIAYYFLGRGAGDGSSSEEGLSE